MRQRDVAVVLFDVDSRARVEVEYDTPLWLATLEWARFHGIDPMRVPAGSEVLREASSFSIYYERIVLADDGGPLVRSGERVVERVLERGEAPPLPFPAA